MDSGATNTRQPTAGRCLARIHRSLALTSPALSSTGYHMQPREHRFAARNVELCYFEWGSAASTQTIVLLHATGFHARCWDQVIQRLPADARIIAVDLRGHGRSGKQPPYIWSTFAGDIIELIQALAIRHAVGAGHSMGGHCLVQVTYALPEAFDRLLLIDPVIMSPELYGAGGRHSYERVEDHPVSRRRSVWSGWQEMYDRFVTRHPYSLWRHDVLEDYCRYGVLPGADGNWTLACPPMVEASVYMNNTSTDVHSKLAKIQQPVTVMRAKSRDFSRLPDEGERMDFSMSPTWPELAGAFPHGEDVYLPELTHFIPMQDPELVAGYLTRMLAAASASRR